MRSPWFLNGGSFLFETSINKNYKCQVFHGACALFRRKRHSPHERGHYCSPLSEPRVFWRHERNVFAEYCHEDSAVNRCANSWTIAFTRVSSDCLEWRKRDWQLVCVFTRCNRKLTHTQPSSILIGSRAAITQIAFVLVTAFNSHKSCWYFWKYFFVPLNFSCR